MQFKSEKYVICWVVDLIWLGIDNTPQDLTDTDIVSRSAKPCLYSRDPYNTNNNELNEYKTKITTLTIDKKNN